MKDGVKLCVECFCELHPTDQGANRDDPEVEGANVAGQDDPVDPTAEVLE